LDADRSICSFGRGSAGALTRPSELVGALLDGRSRFVRMRVPDGCLEDLRQGVIWCSRASSRRTSWQRPRWAVAAVPQPEEYFADPAAHAWLEESTEAEQVRCDSRWLAETSSTVFLNRGRRFESCRGRW